MAGRQNETVTTTDSSTRSPGVRPITWAILAFMLISTAAIIGAWRGSESRYGAVPEVVAASDSGRVTILPYTATDLDGNSYTNPIPQIALADDQTLVVRLPVELQRTRVQVFEVRELGETETDHEDMLTGLVLPVVNERGRLTGLAIRGLPAVYAADGSESILQGEWALSVVPPTT